MFAAEPLIVRPIAHRGAHLGQHLNLFAPALDRLADDFLGATLAIDVGRVQGGDAEIQGTMDHFYRLSLLGTATEVIGPQSHHRDLQARVTRSTILHASLLWSDHVSTTLSV